MDRRNRRGVDEEAASPTTPLLSAPTPPLSAVDMLRETSHVSSITLPSAASRVEEHGGHRQYIKDSVIGFADGLTVPFALTASLTAVGSSPLVIIGGLAELFAGMISMGLGAWLGSVTEAKHYEVELERQYCKVQEQPDREEDEMYNIFDKYRIPRQLVAPIIERFKKDPDAWVDFKMDFQVKMEKPSSHAAKISALVMGMSYFVGGFFPLLPYFLATADLKQALYISIGVAVVVLLFFGYVKAMVIGTKHKDAFISAFQTLVVGLGTAAMSYGIVRGFTQWFGDGVGG